MPEPKKYYIWSKKWTDDYNHKFWGPNKSGYTRDLNDAGVFTEDEIAEFPVITKENLHEMKCHSRETSFAIAVEDVELLGKKMVCVLN